MAVVQQAWFRNRRWAWLALGAGSARSHLELSGLSQIEIEGKRYDFDAVIERTSAGAGDCPLAVASDSWLRASNDVSAQDK